MGGATGGASDVGRIGGMCNGVDITDFAKGAGGGIGGMYNGADTVDAAKGAGPDTGTLFDACLRGECFSSGSISKS